METGGTENPNRVDGFWKAYELNEQRIMEAVQKKELSDWGAVAAKGILAVLMVGGEVAYLSQTLYRIHVEQHTKEAQRKTIDGNHSN